MTELEADYLSLRWTTNVPLKRTVRRRPPDPRALAPLEPPAPERPRRVITSTVRLPWAPRIERSDKP